MAKTLSILTGSDPSGIKFRDLAPTLSKLSKIDLNIPFISSAPMQYDSTSASALADLIGTDNAALVVQGAANGQRLVDIQDVAGTPLQKAVVQGAQQFLGVPYVWGGEDPSGFDCSGLVQYVFGKLGIKTPRVTYQQFAAGKKINPKNVQPGDLVFFRMEQQGPGHVGIYVGNGKYINAPQTGDVVKISELANRSDLVGVRRYT